MSGLATFAVIGTKWANMNGSHGSHFAHQKLMDDWTDRATLAVRAERPEPIEGPVEIVAVVRRTRNGRADAHNVSPTIKACIDGAVKAGLIPDDNDSIVRRLIIEAGPKAAAPCVEFTVRSVEVAS
jgi:hypothetical protein